MGGALLKGLIQAGYNQGQISFFDPNDLVADPLENETGTQRVSNLNQAAAESEIIVLGVKPQIFNKISVELKHYLENSKIIISIMAGVTVQTLSDELGFGNEYVRTMPNIPLTVQQGAIAIATDDLQTETISIVREIFQSVGEVVEVAENQLDAVTGVSGSGPAFVYQFIEGYINAGVRAGLTRDVSEKLVLATIKGSINFLETNNLGTQQATNQVTSPGGTTIYGMQALEENGFKNAMYKAVEAATNRSKELGTLSKPKPEEAREVPEALMLFKNQDKKK